MISAFSARLIDIALAAGAAILDVYRDGATVRLKADDSPVTDADARAEAIILDGLARLAPSTPVLAEERASAGFIPTLGSRFFLVDPLDGTREFLKRNGEFTVNIALIEDGAPTLGLVYAPALRKLYFGEAGRALRFEIGADGALKNGESIRARLAPGAGLTAVASRSHRSVETDDYLARLRVAAFAEAGSSLKFCLLAEGSADIYPRLSRTMEWDTAAGQAVLEAAGGRVETHPERARLVYGKADRGFDNPAFVAWGARSPDSGVLRTQMSHNGV